MKVLPLANFLGNRLGTVLQSLDWDYIHCSSTYWPWHVNKQQEQASMQ